MLSRLINNQGGYGRLTAGTVTLAVTAIIALAYQIYVSQNPTNVTLTRRTIPLATSVQLFPQSLPVLEDTAYLLQVTDEEGDVHTFSKFFQKEKGKLVFATGQVIEDGILPLPPEMTQVVSAELSLFDDRIIQQPVLIPFLSGDIENDRTLLTYTGADFSEAEGEYSLATPTDNNALVNERSGLWFGDVLLNTPALSLPQLPQGWVYEGWAMIDGKPLTTGRFRSVTSADRFSGFSDSQATPPSFPGEDFLFDPPIAIFPDLIFPVDLAGNGVMISIEPDVNGEDLIGEAPFPITVLSASIPNLAQAGVLYDLEFDETLFPKSTLVIRFTES